MMIALQAFLSGLFRGLGTWDNRVLGTCTLDRPSSLNRIML